MRLLIVLLIGAVLYLIFNFVFRRNWFKGLSVDIDFEKPAVREGDSNTLIEVLKNDKAMPLPVVLVKFSITRTFLFPKEKTSSVTDLYYRTEYFSCKPYQCITRKYTFTASKRGEYRISSIDLVCKDFFLSRNYSGGFKRLSSVLVLPGRMKKSEIPKEIIRLNGEIIHRIKQNEDPFEFRGIREYQPYDPMNHINWKASAKSGNLQVNTFHTTNRRSVVILLNMDGFNARKSEVIAEASIKIASTLAAYFIDASIPVALYTNGTDKDSEELIRIEAGSDEGHIRNIDVALAKLEVKEIYSSFTRLVEETVRKNEGDSEFILVSNSRKEELVSLYYELIRLGKRMSFIVPEYAYASLKPLTENKRDIVKWEIDDEG